MNLLDAADVKLPEWIAARAGADQTDLLIGVRPESLRFPAAGHGSFRRRAGSRMSNMKAASSWSIWSPGPARRFILSHPGDGAPTQGDEVIVGWDRKVRPICFRKSSGARSRSGHNRSGDRKNADFNQQNREEIHDEVYSKCHPAVAVAAALMGASATAVSAADLEFYFPVGVNAPAVATIQALTDEWAALNPQHTVKAVYAGNYEETTTKALTAANAGQPPAGCRAACRSTFSR